MRLRDLSEQAVMEAIESFYENANRFISSLSTVVSNSPWALPRRPRRMGIAEYPFFYAAELHQLFDYARGRADMSASYVEGKCEQLMAMLHTTIDGRRIEPDWQTFADTPLGLCILACGARINLRAGGEGRLMTLPEVRVLASWQDKHIERSGLIPREVEDGQLHFAIEEVRQVFEEQGIAV